MSQKITAPYGSWKSPITPDLIVTENIWLGSLIALDGDDIYWIELRPADAGRCVIVKRTANGQLTDVTPQPFNARTRVHEYGGGAYTVADGTIYFSNFADQRVYKQHLGSNPMPITPAGSYRYADYVFDKRHGRLVCVREDHTIADRQAIATLVSLDPTQEDGGTSVGIRQ